MRTITYEEYSGQFNVRDYGAVGDGVTDDSAAIQAALDAAEAAGGGRVNLFPGIFIIGTSLEMPTAVKLQGSNYGRRGSTSCILKLADGANTNVIVAKDTLITRGVVFSQFGIDGNEANNTSGHGIYIALQNNSAESPFITQNRRSPVFHKLMIRECAENGIHLDVDGTTWSQTNAVFDQVEVTKCKGHGIYTNYWTDMFFSRCIPFANEGNGFNLIGAGNTRMTHCKTFYSGEYTFDGIGFNIMNSDRSSFMACEAQEDTGKGFRIEASDFVVMEGCILDANGRAEGVGNGPGIGLELVDCDNFIGSLTSMSFHNPTWQNRGVLIDECLKFDIRLQNDNDLVTYPVIATDSSGVLTLNGGEVRKYSPESTFKRVEFAPLGGAISDETVSGLLLDFDGSDAATMFSYGDLEIVDGASVAIFADKSGNGFDATQTDADYKPTYSAGLQNGLSGLTCDDTDKFELTNVFNGDKLFTECTLFFVLKATKTSYDTIMSYRNGTDGFSLQTRSDGGLQVITIDGGVSTTDAATGTDFFDGNATVVAIRFADAGGGDGTLDLWIDNEATKRIDAETFPLSANFSSETHDFKLIDKLDGELYAVRFFGEALSDTDIDAKRAELVSKWGV